MGRNVDLVRVCHIRIWQNACYRLNEPSADVPEKMMVLWDAEGAAPYIEIK